MEAAAELGWKPLAQRAEENKKAREEYLGRQKREQDEHLAMCERKRKEASE